MAVDIYALHVAETFVTVKEIWEMPVLGLAF